MGSFEEHEDHPELQEEFALPASLIMFHKGDGNPWDSKLGGCPYLHKQEEYPVGQNGMPMLFLAQINLKDIHNIPELPCQGLLQFFVENSKHFGIDAPPVVRWIETVAEDDLAARDFSQVSYNWDCC